MDGALNFSNFTAAQREQLNINYTNDQKKLRDLERKQNRDADKEMKRLLKEQNAPEGMVVTPDETTPEETSSVVVQADNPQPPPPVVTHEINPDKNDARVKARVIVHKVCDAIGVNSNYEVAKVMGALFGILNNSVAGTPAKDVPKKMKKLDQKSFEAKQKEKSEGKPEIEIAKGKKWNFLQLEADAIEELRGHAQVREAKKLLVRGCLWLKRRNLFNRVPQGITLETVGGLPFGSPDEVRAYPGAFGGKASKDIHDNFTCKKTPFVPLPRFIIAGEEMKIGADFPNVEARDMLACIGDGLQDAAMLECIRKSETGWILTGVMLEGDGLIKFRKQGWGLTSIEVDEEAGGSNTVKVKRHIGYDQVEAVGMPVMKKMRVEDIK